MKKLIWLYKLFLGKKYYVEYTNKLRNNEILICGHKIYIGKS